MPNYQLGSSNPTLGHDAGAGVWNGTSTDLSTHAKKAAILAVLPLAMAYPGVDAVQHMYHYFGNSGSDYTIDLAGMVKDVPSAKANIEAEIEAAKRFVETLPDGIHAICSAGTGGGYNTQGESANWYFAIGGYTYWGKGVANVSHVSGTRSFQMTFQFKFYDRYNWDGGKKVTLGGITITDEAMGDFHRQGVAKEYDCYGSVERLVIWGAPVPAPAPVGPVAPPPVKPPTPPVKPPTPPVKPPVKPPVPPVKPPATVYVVKPGDNLSAISAKVYGTSSKWSVIYAANKAVIGPNPNLIYAGQHLFIP